MKTRNCPQEGLVNEAARTGNWTATAAAHAATCKACEEIVQVSRAMQLLAQGSDENLTLPDASLMWYRLTLFEQQSKAERAANILDWAGIVLGLVGSMAMVGWIAWKWVAIQSFLLTWVWTGPQVWLNDYSKLALSLPTAVALCLAVLAVLYPVLVDD